MDSQVSSNLRSRFPDLRLVGFSVLPVHPTASWNEPILTSGKDKRVLVYDEMALQVEAVVLLKLHLPPSRVKVPSIAPGNCVSGT